MKKAFVLLLAVMLCFAISACNSKENTIVGEWELLGICENGTIIPGNFADFKYFNVNLSEDGIVNLLSEPQNYGILGMYHKIGEKSKGVYEYSALMYQNSTTGSQQENLIVKMLYYPDRDEMLMLFSENDGFYFTRVPDVYEEYTPHCADGIHRNKDIYSGNNEAIAAKYGYGWDQVYNDKWGESEWVLKALTTQEELDAYKARAAEFEKGNEVGWYVIPQPIDGYRIIFSSATDNSEN